MRSSICFFALMETSPGPGKDQRLATANKMIANLKNNIHKLSSELRFKSEMLTSALDVAHEQSLQIASLKVAVQDTVHWEPVTCSRLSSSSKPSGDLLWTDAVVRSRSKASRKSASPSNLNTSNHFEALSYLGETLIPDSSPNKGNTGGTPLPTDVTAGVTTASSSQAATDTTSSLLTTTSFRPAHPPAVDPYWPGTVSATSLAQQQIIREATSGHSSVATRKAPFGRTEAASSPNLHRATSPPVWGAHTGSAPGDNASRQGAQQPPPPCPPFLPNYGYLWRFHHSQHQVLECNFTLFSQSHRTHSAGQTPRPATIYPLN